MADFTKDDVLKVAKLAKLGLTDEEAVKAQQFFADALAQFEILQEVDTEGVEILAQTTGLETVLEADEPKKPLAETEDLLKSTGLPVAYQQIKVPPVL